MKDKLSQSTKCMLSRIILITEGLYMLISTNVDRLRHVASFSKYLIGPIRTFRVVFGPTGEMMSLSFALVPYLEHF
jgi:hypothetical protein